MICTAKPKNRLSTNEVLLIIEHSAKSKLVELTFGDLYLRFGTDQTQLTADGFSTSSTPQPDPGTQFSDVDPQDEQRALRDRIEQLTIENPLLAEQLIAEGDLVDDEDSNGGDDEET